MLEVLSSAQLHAIYLFIFSIGLSLGVGSSILSHVLLLFAAHDGRISRDEARLLHVSRTLIWASLLLYGFGGVGLFTLAYESMLGLGIFYASMTIVFILLCNEIIFSIRHVRRLRIFRASNVALDAFLLEGSTLSAVSWIFLAFHHIIYRTDIGYFAFMGLYTFTLALFMFFTWFIRKNTIRRQDVRILKRSLLAAGVLMTLFFFGFLFQADRVLHTKEAATHIQKTVHTAMNGSSAFTRDDVALHNNTEDCWIIIDEKVFNATEPARLHPALFSCGTDASENYHKNHGATIRDKMMKYFIGDVMEGTGITAVDTPFTKNESLNPKRELFVQEGSWQPRELIVIVEKDTENLLFVDGTTHVPVGRIHKVGFQPHTSVFSSDARFMYIISRDGWLTKIDLSTLQSIKNVRVGENSRGTGLTTNDKYIAIGNYDPGNLVILETQTLETVKTIPLTETVNGKEITSRAGAVVENENSIIVALKDATSVWVIDTDQPDFPITHKFSGIGNNIPALHDAFLTPNGKYYVVASQGSKTAWILDLTTMKPLAEIQTGEVPHTGPGATWNNFLYIPSLGEGNITVVDTTTWKTIKRIPTGGPGLFVRSYNKNPNYPYIWADTAFGDHKDEIYVIDGKSNEIIKTLTPLPGEDSWHPEFTYDGKFVYVVSKSGNQIIVYDAYTFEVIKRIPSDTPSAVSNVGIRIEEPGL